jgi:hypothetical protein
MTFVLSFYSRLFKRDIQKEEEKRPSMVFLSGDAYDISMETEEKEK